MNDPAFWDAYRVHLATRRAPRTVRAYLDIARAFVVFLQGDGTRRLLPSSPEAGAAARVDLSVRTIEGFLASPSASGAPRAVTTRNQMLAALRVFCAFAEREGLLSSNAARGVPFLREPTRTPAVLDVAEITALARAAQAMPNEHTRRQLLAMTALLVLCGLRVSELVALDVEQVDLRAGLLRAVAGKGGSRHDVVLSPQAAQLVGDLLRNRVARQADSPALFNSREGTRMSVRTVQRYVHTLGLTIRRRLTPHALRHSSATAALSLGVDVSTVSEHLRHASLATTQRYLHFGLERRRAAAAKLGALFPRDVLIARGEGAEAEVIHSGTIDVFGDLDDTSDMAA